MYPKTFIQNATHEPDYSACFVLIPFNERFDDVMDAIAEAAHELHFTAHRADEVFGGGHIMEDILKGILNSEIIIADLSTKNPNVFYELGVAHMVKDIKKVVMITQTMDDVPFDLRQLRCIRYDNSKSGLGQLKRDLKKAIGEINDGVYRFAVKEGQQFQFPQKVFGAADKGAYDFEISKLMLLQKGAKFRLKLIRHAVDIDPEEVFNSSKGLNVRETWPVPHIPWRLSLESVSNDTAYFCFFKT